MPSVTSCTLKRVYEPATWDNESRGTYTVTYDIMTDGILGPRGIRAGAQSASPHPFPSFGSTYSYQGETDGDAYANLFAIASDNEQQTKHIGSVTYGPPIGNDTGVYEPNPFLRPPVVWADQEVFTRVIERDIFGKAVANPCGVGYDTPLEKEDTRSVLVVEFNVATIGEVIQYQRYLRRAVNETPWHILGQVVPPRNAFARSVVGTPPITQGAYTYYHLAFRFAFADLGFNWDEALLARGYGCFELDRNGDFITVENTAGEKRKKITQYPDGECHNLKADGTNLPDGEPGVFVDWRINREVDFNALPFSG
jgi:hypothetical protein